MDSFYSDINYNFDTFTSLLYKTWEKYNARSTILHTLTAVVIMLLFKTRSDMAG